MKIRDLKQITVELAPSLLVQHNPDDQLAFIHKNDENGFFFVLEGLTAEIFLMIFRATPLPEIRAALAAKYRKSGAIFDSEFEALLEILKKERLASVKSASSSNRIKKIES